MALNVISYSYSLKAKSIHDIKTMFSKEFQICALMLLFSKINRQLFSDGISR